MSLDDGVVTFAICIRDIRASDLTTRHRFKEKLKVTLELDDKKFKTKKELVGGGDVAWKQVIRFEWQLRQPTHSTDSMYEAIKRELEHRFFKATISCQHDHSSNPLASLSLDLYTACTGPADHNLPLKNAEGATVGRLHFGLEMTQLSNVAVIFKYIKVRNLKSMEHQVQGVNPYLKYGYSKHWAAIQERKMKAIYSAVQHQNSNPEWRDLPWLRFKTSLNELVRESIVVHITHKGRNHNVPIGRVNLLFRTLVDNGKSFKEEDTISFKGPLKVDNAEIEGNLNFKFLPRFAQMVPVTVIRKPIHTEKGIFDAMPLLPHLPKPNVPVMRSAEVETSLDTDSPLLSKKPASRLRSSTGTIRSNPKPAEITSSDKKKTSKPKSKTSSSSTTKSEETRRITADKSKEEDDSDLSSVDDSDAEGQDKTSLSRSNSNSSTSFVEDLIDLSSPAMKRDRSMSCVASSLPQYPFASSMSNNLPFQTTFGTGHPILGNNMSLSLSPTTDTVTELKAPTTATSESSQQEPTFNPFAQPLPAGQGPALANPFSFGNPQAPSQPLANPFAV